MPHAEFMAWIAFHNAFPFDDLHRYHRPAALVATSLSGGHIEDRLEWLFPEPIPEGFSQADLNTFKALGARPPQKD